MSTITSLKLWNVPICCLQRNCHFYNCFSKTKNKEKQKLCQVLCVCGAKYDMCSDIRSHAYTTAVWIKKIGQHIADFHMWIIYPHRQENTRSAQNRMRVAGFGRGTWAWARLPLIMFEQKRSRWKIHSRWMSMVTVASLPLGAALLEARQVICWPLSMFEAEMWSVLTVLSLLPSRNSVCMKTQTLWALKCHGAALHRWATIFSELKRKKYEAYFLLSVGQRRTSELAISSSLLEVSEQTMYPTTLESRAPNQHVNMQLLHSQNVRFAIRLALCWNLYQDYYTGIFHRRHGVEVTHFICHSQSSLFMPILPALLSSRIQAIVEEQCLLKKDY